jgi:hypothetical protein
MSIFGHRRHVRKPKVALPSSRIAMRKPTHADLAGFYEASA